MANEPQTDSPGLSLTQLLEHCRQQRWLLISCTLIGGLAAAIYVQSQYKNLYHHRIGVSHPRVGIGEERMVYINYNERVVVKNRVYDRLIAEMPAFKEAAEAGQITKPLFLANKLTQDFHNHRIYDQNAETSTSTFLSIFLPFELPAQQLFDIQQQEANQQIELNNKPRSSQAQNFQQLLQQRQQLAQHLKTIHHSYAQQLADPQLISSLQQTWQTKDRHDLKGQLELLFHMLQGIHLKGLMDRETYQSQRDQLVSLEKSRLALTPITNRKPPAPRVPLETMKFRPDSITMERLSINSLTHNPMVMILNWAAASLLCALLATLLPKLLGTRRPNKSEAAI